MIIKAPDENASKLATLEGLRARRDAGADQRKRIDQELRNIRAGIKGEKESAYEIDFHFGPSKNYAIIHDLRIEVDGRVAQIDHLVINRFLEIWVCESKHFSEGIAINERGECSAFFNDKPYGVASPFEQNKKHVLVLRSLFSSGMVQLPKRMGFAIKPKMISVVLVSKGARITRPKTKVEGLESIIKNDQFRSLIDRAIDGDNNPLTMARVVGADTLENLARAIAAQHKPIEFRWAAKFGLGETSPGYAPGPVATTGPMPPPWPNPPPLPTPGRLPNRGEDARPATEEKKTKKKLICDGCSERVEFVVARFCWTNKPKKENGRVS